MRGIYELYDGETHFIQLALVRLVHSKRAKDGHGRGKLHVWIGDEEFIFTIDTYANAKLHARAIAEAISAMNTPMRPVTYPPSEKIKIVPSPPGEWETA